MDVPLLCVDDQTQTRGLDSTSLDPARAEKHLDPASTDILTNVSKCHCDDKSAESDHLNLSSCNYNVSDSLTLHSEPVSSEPALPLLPHHHCQPYLAPSESLGLDMEQEASLFFPLIPNQSVLETSGAMSSFCGGLTEQSTSELLSFSSAQSQAAFPQSSSSPQSDSGTSTLPDLYIFESETHDFILDSNAEPSEIKCPDNLALSRIKGNRTHVLMCDSADVSRATDEQATVDYVSVMRPRMGPTAPVADDCEVRMMSGNDGRPGTAGVTSLTSERRQSDSTIELWLDACQYLAGEETGEVDVRDGGIHPVMQEELAVTSDLSFPPGETQESCYNPEGSDGIGWSSQDTRCWGQPVERWSSVDSWTTALSDWTGIITASAEDITSAFTEIGAEIEALTQALAEIRDTESSTQEGSEPIMGVQHQPFEAQNPPDGSILSAAPELQDRAGSQNPEGIQSSHIDSFLAFHSPTASSNAKVAFPGGFSEDQTAVTHESISCTQLDLSQFDRHSDSLDLNSLHKEDPIILNITEETDLEGENAVGQPSGDGLCEVTYQESFSLEQDAEKTCPTAKVDIQGSKSSIDFVQPLTDSHVPGVEAQPVPSLSVSDTSLDLDGTCQVEPHWGSPKFIMPLAPLSIASSLVCRVGSSLEGDQICAKASPGDKPGCDSIPVRRTLDGITDRSTSEEHICERESTIAGGQLYLDTGIFFAERKTIIEEINDLSRELSHLAVVPADHFLISENDCIAVITLDINDPFLPRPIKPTPTAEKMPHRSHKHMSEGKARSKKDKSAGHHHGPSNKQEILPQTNKQQETCLPTRENHSDENAAVGVEDSQTKSGIEVGVVVEKAPNKPHHGKKKKKHGQSTAALKSSAEPLVDDESGAKPKTAKGRIEMFEAKLSTKAETTQRVNDHSDVSEKKQSKVKASQGEQPALQAENKEHLNFTTTTSSPLKDDVIKRRRLSEDKFGKIVSALETKSQKPDICTKAKTEADAEAARKKAHGEVVKQKLPPKEEPKVVQPIQAVPVSGDPQSLSLWCQFGALSSDYTVTWSREGVMLAEVKRSAEDQSRVSLTISDASHKDLGKYQCRISSSQGSVTLDYLLTYELLSQIIIPSSPITITPSPVDVGSEEEEGRCSRLMFKEDFLSEQYFGDNHPISIVTEKVHFGEGMHRRAFRTKLRTSQIPRLLPGHSCVLKVHNAISYGTKNNTELVEKNFTLAVEECQVQNTAREYIMAYTAAAQSVEAFGEVPEIIPIYLVHRPSNGIPYATLEEELIGDFVKYSVKDGKEINLMRRESEAGQKCCAFQHWVYHNTEGNLLVTDMQGVGMRLTDVGIATCKKGYKGFKGNCSTSFIDQFKALHQCNRFCEILGLTSLQPKPKKPSSGHKPKAPPPAACKKKTFGPTLKGKS